MPEAGVVYMAWTKVEDAASGAAMSSKTCPRHGTWLTAKGRKERLITRMCLAAASLGSALTLAACDAGITTYRSEAAGSISAQTYAPYAAMDGTSLAVIRNNPFAGDRDNQLVLATMRTHNPMLKYRFALAPTPDWNGYSVIFVFGEPPIGNQNLCQNATLPPRPMPAGTTTVMADLCYGPLLITEVYGHTAAVRGPDDPRFASLVGGVLEDLFALRRPRDPRAWPRRFIP